MPEEGRAKKTPAPETPAGLPRAAGDQVNEVGHERRVLTALCYDLVGSTDLLRRLDIEDFQELLSAFQQAAKQAVASCSGRVEVEIGDGGFALFPTIVDVRDAASLAIRAGLEIVEACRRVGKEKGRRDLHVRVGIATSMTLVQAGKADQPANVTGAAFAMAMRLQAIAEPDTVCVSTETRNLARRSHVFSFRGAHELKGFATPEPVWRALRHKREVDRFFAFRRLATPFVGRADELRVVAEAWSNAVAGKGSVVFIEGEAGIGKSRLVYEVRRAARLQRVKLLLFQCLPGGARSTLHPLLQNMQGDWAGGAGSLTFSLVAEEFGRLGIHDPDVVDVFCFLLGVEGRNPGLKDADPETIREKANFAVRRGLEAMCASGPLVLVVEDIHWIDPTSRQLLMEAARFVQRCPILLIVTSRPGSSGWQEIAGQRSISLRRLDPQETRTAITAMWPATGSSTLPELLDVMERVTGGVPLFIEEVCQWVAENSASATDRLAQTASPSQASIFESVLDSRLEPLGPAREVARAGAVAGNRFNLPLLRELLPGFDDDSIGNALHALNEAGFLTRVRAPGVRAYAFRHALIQETIYNALLRRKRQAFHRRLFAAVDGNRELASWMRTDEIAEHAERAGLLDKAIELFVAAGKESYARSAMVEARHLLEHALALCEEIDGPGEQDILRLTAMAALGPILTAAEGPNSAPARKLYEDGVEIARRRPATERARWFPIYWGWWFTDTVLNGERAQAVLSDLKDVEDPEVQLQARHCVWAIDFYLGRHESCIEAVDAGLALYGTGGDRDNVTLFGGHDARVCGLAHKGLSQWFLGRAASAVRSLSEARRWAQQTGHVGSIAHVYINEAMLHCYRRDFSALRTVIAEIGLLTGEHHLPSLAAPAQVFEGWCEGNSGHVERGRDMIRQALSVHGELQTPEDYPVYCGMLVEMMAQTGEIAEGLALLSAATAEAEQGGHRYWQAELHRRRALLLFRQGAPVADIVSALDSSLAIAAEQNAVPILLSAYDALVSLGLSPSLVDTYRDRVERAKAALEPGAALIVDPEPALWNEPAK